MKTRISLAIALCRFSEWLAAVAYRLYPPFDPANWNDDHENFEWTEYIGPTVRGGLVHGTIHYYDSRPDHIPTRDFVEDCEDYQKGEL